MQRKIHKKIKNEDLDFGMKLDFGFWEDQNQPKPRIPNPKSHALKLFLVIFIILLTSCGYEQGSIEPEYDKDGNPIFNEGDVVGHTSNADYLGLLRNITESPYTHVGILVKENGKIKVLEAVGSGVEINNFASFKSRGENGKFTVLRVKPEFQDSLKEVMDIAKSFIGKDYDDRFEPDDNRIYCSELIYKAFKRGSDAKAGKMKSLSDVLGVQKYNPIVSAVIKRKFGGKPDDILVVSPGSVMRSGYFDVIYTDY
mgnify:CR=1 FL=1